MVFAPRDIFSLSAPSCELCLEPDACFDAAGKGNCSIYLPGCHKETGESRKTIIDGSFTHSRTHSRTHSGTHTLNEIMHCLPSRRKYQNTVFPCPLYIVSGMIHSKGELSHREAVLRSEVCILLCLQWLRFRALDGGG